MTSNNSRPSPADYRKAEELALEVMDIIGSESLASRTFVYSSVVEKKDLKERLVEYFAKEIVKIRGKRISGSDKPIPLPYQQS